MSGKPESEQAETLAADRGYDDTKRITKCWNEYPDFQVGKRLFTSLDHLFEFKKERISEAAESECSPTTPTNDQIIANIQLNLRFAYRSPQIIANIQLFKARISFSNQI